MDIALKKLELMQRLMPPALARVSTLSHSLGYLPSE